MTNPKDSNQTEQSTGRQNKSKVKREVQEITKLGERLLSLPTALLKQYPLPDYCLKALLEGQKITSHIGRKRQIKYIGKLLREQDLEAVHQKLAILDQEKALEIKQQHHIEDWRERLLKEGDKAAFELFEQAPQLDRQHLRQLIRNAQKEIKAAKPPKYQRELFRYLRDSLSDD